jgi:pilus assembly protein CpaB
VLSVGSQVERGPDGSVLNASTAALEVTPQEAEQLALAANQGKIQLVLRGYGDPDMIDTDGATLRSLLRADEQRAGPVDSTPAKATAKPAPAPRAAPSAPVRAAAPSPRRPDSLTVRIYQREKATSTSVVRRSPSDTLSDHP